LQEFLRQDPTNWRLRAEVFDAALTAGELESARTLVESALGERPSDASWIHRQAVLMLARGEHPQAQAVLESLIASGRGEPAIRHNLALALFSQGQYGRASEQLAPLLERQEDDATVAWTLWLRCQHRSGSIGEALETFRGGALQRRIPLDAWGVASLMAVDVGRFNDARAWCQRALQQQPDQMEALAARGALELAAEDPQAALGWFGRALEVRPDDGRTWSGLALAKMLVRDFAGADEAFGRATAGNLRHTGTWVAWGWCRLLRNDSEAARQVFEESVRLDRSFGEGHGGLAVALLQLGRGEEAKRELQIALRLDAKGLGARYAQALLSGEARDPARLSRLSETVLAQLRQLLSPRRERN
jgi:Flp pilus assembly protein TadD